LAAIQASLERGYSPTVRELAAELGLRSPAPLHRYLERLRDEGKVSWETGKARTLRVVA
jgi:repressor LexA